MNTDSRRQVTGVIQQNAIPEGGAKALGEGFRQDAMKTTPMGRMGVPDDIGPVAVFLASDDSHWVTGQRIIVGGGQTM